MSFISRSPSFRVCPVHNFLFQTSNSSNSTSELLATMKTTISLLLVATFAGLTLLPPSQGFKLSNNVKPGLKNLSPAEKLVARIAQPGSADANLPKGIFELFQIDMPAFFLQITGLGDSIRVPDTHAEYSFEVCPSPPLCIVFTERWDVRDTVIQRASGTTFNTSMNGTKFQLGFNIPNVQIHSPGLVYDSNSTLFNTRTVMRGLDIFIRNYTIRFSADLRMASEGLRLHNLDFLFDVDELTARFENETSTDANGKETEHGSEEFDLKDILLENIWTEDVQEGFKRTQEMWLNCFLSNGRISPFECQKYLSDKYHRQSFAQLIHAIGLGQMLGQAGSST